LPQVVPSATFVALLHCEVPLVQSVEPVWQTLPPGLHAAPAVQAPHWPLLQTWPEPQLVPLAATPLFVQTPVPELQSMYPTRHALFCGEQGALLVQETQTPLLQTWLVPHGDPLASGLAPLQTDAPLAHDVVPERQTLGVPASSTGVQVEFAVQPTHVPSPSQTWLAPHVVPGGALPSLSWQKMPPSTHWALPVWHGLSGGVHAAPLVQAAHAPLSQ
jgi:hypothetical protein